MVLHGHFLYFSNGNFVSQKEQIKLVGAESPGGVGEGVDLDASSSVETFSCSGCSWESFMVVTGLQFTDFLVCKNKKIHQNKKMKRKNDKIKYWI